MTEVLVRAFPGRVVHGTGDAAFHGERLVIKGATWTTRLPASAVLYGPEPPRTGRRGQPAKKGARIGKCKDAAQAAEWQDVTVRIYGKERQVQAAGQPALWYGSFKSAPGQLVLMREKDSKKLYDLGLFSLDMSLPPAGVIERYSWRWPIEPSNADMDHALRGIEMCLGFDDVQRRLHCLRIWRAIGRLEEAPR